MALQVTQQVFTKKLLQIVMYAVKVTILASLVIWSTGNTPPTNMGLNFLKAVPLQVPCWPLQFAFSQYQERIASASK